MARARSMSGGSPYVEDLVQILRNDVKVLLDQWAVGYRGLIHDNADGIRDAGHVVGGEDSNARSLIVAQGGADDLPNGVLRAGARSRRPPICRI